MDTGVHLVSNPSHTDRTNTKRIPDWTKYHVTPNGHILMVVDWSQSSNMTRAFPLNLFETTPIPQWTVGKRRVWSDQSVVQFCKWQGINSVNGISLLFIFKFFPTHLFCKGSSLSSMPQFGALGMFCILYLQLVSELFSVFRI